MLKVKPIPFPSFDRWWAAKDSQGHHSWSCNIGDFWAVIKPVGWSSTRSEKRYVMDTTEYAFAIAASDVPTNIYVDKVFMSCYDHYDHYGGDDDETIEQRDDRIHRLREWYVATAIKANERWAEYITKNYLIDEEQS